jgi:methylglutaconyl-CoA hydratase
MEAMTETRSDPVLLEARVGGVVRLTLNRPEKRNALNQELVSALTAAMARTAADTTVRVVAIAGAGKDFCAGLDLAELARVAEPGVENSYAEGLASARALGALFARMRAHPRPLVALVQGRALAGGCGIATACDLVLASEAAELAYTEIHLGFVPALVMSLLRRKVGETRAFELVALGNRYSARESQDLGLVNRVFVPEAFDRESAAYLEELASRPPGALALTKRLLYELDGMPLPAALERGAEINAQARMSEECRTGVRRFLEKKEPKRP